jgi:antibiotic biosynthesis monooxygenase (ABM) superfamily enzyme
MIAAMTTLARHPRAAAARTAKPPAPAAARLTPRKLWLLMTLGIYPIITTLQTVADPSSGTSPGPEQFALVRPVMVAVMVWVAIPFRRRYFGGSIAR